MIRPLFRRNFTSRARELSGGDAVIVSIPKSGRTWMRTFLCAYFCKRHGLEMTLDPERYHEPGIPRVIYSHDLFEQHTKSIRFWDRARGKYLIPAAQLRTAPVILLSRDPRDAFVSHYVQLTRRTPETPAYLKNKTAGELLRDPRYGIEPMIEVMNSWLREFVDLPRFALVRYEDLRCEPVAQFRRLLEALGQNEIEAAAFEHALTFSDFGNMKKFEAAGAFESKILQAGDVADPESFKVRRGKIGGYEEDLSPGDQAYAAAAMRRLDERFGYKTNLRPR